MNYTHVLNTHRLLFQGDYGLFSIQTGLPLTFPCAVRVQFWYTPSQTVDFIDNKPEFTRQNGGRTTPNTHWMSVYVPVDQVVAGSNPV